MDPSPPRTYCILGPKAWNGEEGSGKRERKTQKQVKQGQHLECSGDQGFVRKESCKKHHRGFIYERGRKTSDLKHITNGSIYCALITELLLKFKKSMERDQLLQQTNGLISFLYKRAKVGNIPKTSYTRRNLVTLNDIFNICCLKNYCKKTRDMIGFLSTRWYKVVRSNEKKKSATKKWGKRQRSTSGKVPNWKPKMNSIKK